MAQKIQVILTDDLDGSSADETVSFSLDGVAYEIDLSTEHAQKLRDSFAEWIGNARKQGRSTPARASRGTRRASSSASSNATEVREWARANGYKVNERGRIAVEVQQAYDAAH
ncbi:Lsr2 protein [Sediminihabitans luteus]|uniref:Lsr2 protein n=1 Tax=Sediminihabitans luteus TaxID=1138585 RepID=A0A2M9CEB6_9CELL|nr:Lsr2 family protein [Sediminihabitans luteus]PJJ70229.1 Lsr2 protein [Sediminihabitans luteus]